MLVADLELTKRIALEAEALSESGHEVILIAGRAVDGKAFERVGSLKIEHCRARPPQDLSRRASAAINRSIAALNRLSMATQRLFEGRVTAVNASFERINERDLRARTKRYGNALLLWWRERLVGVLQMLLRAYAWSGRGIYAAGRTAMRAGAKVRYGGQTFERVIAQRAIYYDPDVVHAHDLPVLGAALSVKRRLRIPLVYDAHEFYPEQLSLRPLERTRLRRRERRLIRRADRVITVNHMIAALMEARYRGVRVTVVENAMPMAVNYGIDRGVDRFREEFGVAAEATILLYQGWLAPERNLEILIQGMADVQPGFVLVLMGYGDYTVTLAEMAQALVEEGRVVFVPSRSQDELISYTASADIGLIPYPYGRDLNTHYCSPNKLYEYIAAELPMLSNELPFVKETLERYGFGCVRDMSDSDAFARAVNTFPLDRLQEMKGALARNKHLFDWAREAGKLLEIYGALDRSEPKCLAGDSAAAYGERH